MYVITFQLAETYILDELLPAYLTWRFDLADSMRFVCCFVYYFTIASANCLSA